MIPSKGYAVQDATTDLAPWNFERRELDHTMCNLIFILWSLPQWFASNKTIGSIYPMVPGHEIVGKVVQVGSHVKKFKVET
jgi:uncharacterized zinc-type alcohol dehydrogenase-like protein